MKSFRIVPSGALFPKFTLCLESAGVPVLTTQARVLVEAEGTVIHAEGSGHVFLCSVLGKYEALLNASYLRIIDDIGLNRRLAYDDYKVKGNQRTWMHIAPLAASFAAVGVISEEARDVIALRMKWLRIFAKYRHTLYDIQAMSASVAGLRYQRTDTQIIKSATDLANTRTNTVLSIEDLDLPDTILDACALR